jgi:hypothetical protein
MISKVKLAKRVEGEIIVTQFYHVHGTCKFTLKANFSLLEKGEGQETNLGKKLH